MRAVADRHFARAMPAPCGSSRCKDSLCDDHPDPAEERGEDEGTSHNPGISYGPLVWARIPALKGSELWVPLFEGGV